MNKKLRIVVDVEHRRQMIEDIQEQVKAIPNYSDIFKHGYLTGMLNAIDPQSPHCVKSEVEAVFWKDKIMCYLQGYKHGRKDELPES